MEESTGKGAECLAALDGIAQEVVVVDIGLRNFCLAFPQKKVCVKMSFDNVAELLYGLKDILRRVCVDREKVQVICEKQIPRATQNVAIENSIFGMLIGMSYRRRIIYYNPCSRRSLVISKYNWVYRKLGTKETFENIESSLLLAEVKQWTCRQLGSTYINKYDDFLDCILMATTHKK